MVVWMSFITEICEWQGSALPLALNIALFVASLGTAEVFAQQHSVSPLMLPPSLRYNRPWNLCQSPLGRGQLVSPHRSAARFQRARDLQENPR